MRKIFKLGTLVCLSVFMMACSVKKEQSKEESTSRKEIGSEISSEDKSVIYTTFFPVTDLTKRIVGDKMEVKQIMQASDEPHSFELQINDMKELTDAKLIIFNGANMESWIMDLENAIGDEDKFLDLSQGLTLLESKGAEEHGEEEGDHDHNINPHTWLSLKNAMEQLDTIYQKVSTIDPENDGYYKENLDKAVKEFMDLDQKFKDELAKLPSDQEKYFVVSHAAFNYLAEDYGLKQIAVTGISPEEEPSAKQLKDIADFVSQHKISTIFFEGKATPKVAETLAETTHVKTGTMYTMETLNEEEIEMGYLKLMEMNLNALLGSFNE